MSNIGRPMRPDEVVDVRVAQIPPEVFDAWNELIAKGWDGRNSTVNQEAIISKIIGKLQKTDPAFTRPMVYSNKYLDVEEIYRKAGWKVKYVDNYFEFTKQA